MSTVEVSPYSVFRSACVFLLTVALVVSYVPFSAQPASANGVPGTYWVDDGGNDGNPGTEAEPFKTITHALSVASQGGIVMVKPGTYDAANGETFPLYSYGVSLKSTDGTATTVLDADGTSGILLVEGPMTGLEIRGLTFREGGLNSGAGVLVHAGNATTTPDAPVIADNYFTGNSSDYSGGALNIFASSGGPLRPLIQNNVFVGNSAEQGGAMQIGIGTRARVRANVFEGNHSNGAGGTLCLQPIDGDAVEITGNFFDDNDAGGNGGAIYANATGTAEVRITENRFGDNDAGRNGGALHLSGTGFVISGNDARGNYAMEKGGFAYLWSGEATSTNNAVGGSGSPDDGGAWYIAGGRFRAFNDTIVATHDGACSMFALPAADAALANCILWNDQEPSEVVGFDSVSYSCIRDAAVASKNAAAGPGNIFSDPLWAYPEERRVDIGLGSPCIDAADSTVAPADDFYGVARPVDGDGDGVARPDIGCCERTGVKTVTTLSAPSTCSYASLKVTGTLKDNAGGALAGLPVLIEYSYDNFGTVAGSKTATSIASGAFSASFAPTKKTYYRAQFRGDLTRLPSTRVTRTVLPRVYLTKPYAYSPQRYRRSYRVRGYLKPRHTAGYKPIQIRAYRYSNGKYRYKKTYYAKSYDYSTYTRYSVYIKLPSRGKWRMRAVHPSDAKNAATYSSYRYVTVK